MKLWVLSDLHLEHSPLPDLVAPNADVSVVAGDVMIRGVLPSLRWLDEHVAPHMPVVFCAGNHEFYRGFLHEDISAARQYRGSGRAHFLEDRTVNLGDVTFAGQRCGPTSTSSARTGRMSSSAPPRAERLPAREYTKTPFKPLYPVQTFQKHIVSRRFLEDCLRERGGGKLVFVTHHAPSMRSVEDRFRKDVLSAAYASKLEHMMADVRGPDLWVHGHLHNRSDYVVGSTRVVCNPRGYPRESSSRDFDGRLVIDV